MGVREWASIAALAKRRKAVVAHVGARVADHPEAGRQQAPLGQVVDGRQQLSLGQVAGRAEDREQRRLAGSADPQALTQRVVLRPCASAHSRTTAWPPNWLRSAAIAFIANGSGSRDVKRAISAIAMAGAATPSLIASITVQRPSPESST